jgi:anti-sigma-K factor RskA
MNMMNKEPERHEIEALLPWHAAGTLNRRDADRVEQALAGDRELRRRFDIVREELSETIHLNETLGAPSARAMEKLFAAIDAEGVRTPTRRASFDFAGRVSDFLSGFSPRTLAWSAAAAALAIVVQAAVITGVVMKEQGPEATYRTADIGAQPTSDGAYAVVRFAPQASSSDITNFLGAHMATLVDGPKAGGLYRIRFAGASVPKDQVNKMIRRMQEQTKVVSFIAAAE